MIKPLPAAAVAILATTTLFVPAAHAAPVTLGIDVLMNERLPELKGKRLGLVVHAAAVDGNLVPTVDRLRAAKDVTVTQLWAPEHGLEGALPNGQSGPTGKDARTEIPVEGLFGGRIGPSPETLARVDIVLFDLQDIGSRTYTYASTLGEVMEACAKAKKPLWVLDRPNPIGGLLFEGPIRKPRWQSLIGWGPVPVSHGMTFGELAKFYQQELKLKTDLVVVAMKGWTRGMVWDDTGLLWVPPSPGIPHPLNAYLYVATGMVGGSGPNVNEGGGNSMPFELIGAPFVDPHKLFRELQKDPLPGLRFRPMTFRPWRGQFGGKIVHGVQLYVTDPHQLRPLRTAVAILAALRKTHPAELKVEDETRFHRTWGDEDVWPAIEAGKGWRELEKSWEKGLVGFGEKRGKVLMYPL